MFPIGLPRAAGRMALSGSLAAALAGGRVAPGVAAPAVAAPAVAAAGAKSVALKRGTVTLRFTARAFAELTKSTTGPFARTRTVTPIAPGASAVPGVFKFPLTRGKLNVHKLTGQVASRGGLNFDSSSTSPVLGTTTSRFALTTFALHFAGALPVLSATFVGASTSPNAPLATLSTRHAGHLRHGRRVTISRIVLKLTSTGVQALAGQNTVFKVGQTIGTASVSATT